MSRVYSLESTMIIVTGAAGFIGSCVVAKLNERGEEDLILVDHLDGMPNSPEANPLKKKNLENKKYQSYFEKQDFIEKIKTHNFKGDIHAIIHMGACSSTTCQDAEYFKTNNLEYTQTLAEYCLKNNIRFIYASSAATYGDGAQGYRDDDATIRKCQPLNLYGKSKQDFDLWALDNNVSDRMVGLKFFNVFGPNEYHKGDMRSVVAKAYKDVTEKGVMRLFKSDREDYADGEQKRDFVYVKDAVDMVLFFLDNPSINGIYNVGTGQARSWNDLAHALFAAVGKEPNIEYFDMPEQLKGKYQYFTQAEMQKLMDAGYDKPISSLEDAVKDYANYLKTEANY